MKLHLFIILLFLLAIGFAVEDVTTTTTRTISSTTNSATDFGSYCSDKCISSYGEEKCKAVCSDSGEVFQSACSSTCVEKGFSKEICSFGCALAERKRDTVRDCFNPCITTGSTSTCEDKCDVNTLLSQLRIEAAKISTTNVTAVSIKRIEKIADIIGISKEAVAETALRKNITVRAGKMNISTIDGKRVVKIPVDLNDGEKLSKMEDRVNGIKIEGDTVELPLKSKVGKSVARIIMQTEGVVGKDGSGEASVTKMVMKSDEVRAEFKAAVSQELKTRLKETKVTIDADLKDLPEGVSVDIKSSDVPERKLAKFKELAKKVNLEIKDRVVAVEVEKENLTNIDHIERAKIKIKVDKEWVNSVGGVSKARIVREDSENYEILNTTAVGEEDGLVVFEGDSPNGLSLYALVTVEPLTPTSSTAASTTANIGEQQKLPVNFVIIGAVAIIVIVAIAVLFFGKKRTTGSRK